MIERPINSVAQLMVDHGLTQEEAHLIAHVVPVRDTPDWERREKLRQRIGNNCISLQPLTHALVESAKEGWR